MATESIGDAPSPVYRARQAATKGGEIDIFRGSRLRNLLALRRADRGHRLCRLHIVFRLLPAVFPFLSVFLASGAFLAVFLLLFFFIFL